MIRTFVSLVSICNMELPAKKSLGQHFLTSVHVLEQIISAAQIKKGERVLEIGPGTGILTRALLDVGAKVLAVEKDDRALTVLKEKFAAEIVTEQLYLIHDDILELRKQEEEKILLGTRVQSEDTNVGAATKLPESGEEFSPLPVSFAVVANIPYYITGAILESFLEHEPRPDRMILLVQKEVAERIIAKSDKTNGKSEVGKESILSISVKAFGTPKMVAKVARGAFNPPPTVESAILSIENISDEQFKQNNVAIPQFFRILKAGFAHKRKFVKRNIEEVLSAEEKIKLEEAWKKLSLDEKVRAEDLPLEKWLLLTAYL
ncbi:MAG: 16S rRNA (adenine(1518)-N(6)/adenine(1519)-N(6))-dimethyltransferase RsmA [Patescibacteria group bacterium]